MFSERKKNLREICCTTVVVLFLLAVSFMTRTYTIQLASGNNLLHTFQEYQGLQHSSDLKKVPNYIDLLKQPTFKFNQHFKNPCWFEENVLHCLPYMYLLGVKKCGTTNLFRRLARHPDFLNPGFREAQWFARKRFENTTTDDIRYYVKMFDNVAKKISLNLNLKTQAGGSVFKNRYITGEKSPSNLHINSHWKELHGNENQQEPKIMNLDYIQHFIPKAKLVIIFRNPVDRLFSDYFHEYGTLMPDHKPNIQEFHTIVEKGIKRYKACFKIRTVRSCVYEPDIYEETKVQIQLGIYYIYWQDILRRFPREQVLILKTEHLRHNFNNDMNYMFKFLKIRVLSKKDMLKYRIALSKHRPASNRPPMLNETADMLHSFYEPFNKIMVEMTDDKEFMYNRH